MKTTIIVSGIPASGKTTLAIAMALELGFEHLDKDVFLEGHFNDLCEFPSARRNELSRAADLEFKTLAMTKDRVVLSSWWRHPQSALASGTSFDRLIEPDDCVVELHCQCASSLAVERFLARQRHPGHLDALRRAPVLLKQFSEAAALGPLLRGRAIFCGTSKPLTPADVCALAAQVHQFSLKPFPVPPISQ